MDTPALLDAILAEVNADLGVAAPADYIPALAQVDPKQFGMAVVGTDGSVFGVGDWNTPFSLQSVSKVFTLALVLSRDEESLWPRVGKEPSGNPFNSLIQLENEAGIPRNPFINAGAMVTTDHLASLAGDAAAELLGFLRAETGNPTIDVDPAIRASEADHADRNLALAHFMASYGNMINPVATVVDQYVRQCSLAMSCQDVAKAGLFLARHGMRADGTRLLTRSQAKRLNAIMLTCGTYDAAGEFAYRVGVPAKSGVGGGILAVVPGRCTICVWSPGLDSHGNSVAGVAALDRFTTETGWSVF